MYSKRNWNTWKPTSQFATTLLYDYFFVQVSTIKPSVLHCISYSWTTTTTTTIYVTIQTALHYIHIHGQYEPLKSVTWSLWTWTVLEGLLICGAKPTEVPIMRTRGNQTTEHKQADNAAAGAGPTLKWTICLQNYRDTIHFVWNLSFPTKG
jgi:hypothetical protein